MIDLLPSWQLSLLAEHKSPNTIKAYLDGVKQYIRWGGDELTKSKVQEFLASIGEPETAIARRTALRRFSAWLVEEGELDSDPLIGVKRPQLTKKVVPALDENQLKLLIKACQGKEFQDRRDEALVRLMLETGLRAGEAIDLEVADVNLLKGLVMVRRGKGGKGRVVPIGAQTAASLDRYIRVRKTHRLAGTATLWLGRGGKTLGYYGMARALKIRAKAAGIDGFHVHVLRHTAATRWLRNGGSETGLMAVAGWSTRDMIDRYAGAGAGERAAVEARKLNLGDV